MKQTAVQWLKTKYKLQGMLFDKDFQQAKEMGKHQIIETARFYFHERGKATPEQYYNKEYGGEK